MTKSISESEATPSQQSAIKKKTAENADETAKVPSTSKAAAASKIATPTYPAAITISMSGCGFLCSYHIGAMICFQKHAKSLLSNVSMYCGSSAGALIASLMALAPDSLEEKLKQIHELASQVPKIYALLNRNHSSFNIAQQLADLVDQHLPQDISAANGRLVISLTRQRDYSNRLISEFPDRDYLMRCLNASCYIPFYSRSTPPIIDDEPYIDGGYSNNLPMISGMHTITISPFSGSAKIAPQRTSGLNFDFGHQITFGQQQLNVNYDNIVRVFQSLFPNDKALIDRLFEQGYRDTMRYLLKRGYYERAEGTEI